MHLVAWFQIVVGLALVALWTFLLAAGQVPEVQEGRVDIWFQIAAEMVMAGLLLAAGTALLRRSERAVLLSALALGWLGYSAVNSPGYYPSLPRLRHETPATGSSSAAHPRGGRSARYPGRQPDVVGAQLLHCREVQPGGPRLRRSAEPCLARSRPRKRWSGLDHHEAPPAARA
jgi:hypothetical protein